MLDLGNTSCVDENPTKGGAGRHVGSNLTQKQKATILKLRKKNKKKQIDLHCWKPYKFITQVDLHILSMLQDISHKSHMLVVS